MKKSFCLTLIATLAANIASAQFVINSSPGLFAPSYRSAANTTWFGWMGNPVNGFDGASNDEVIDNPAPNLGTAPIGLSLTQSPTSNDILSGGNNIYTGGAPGNTDLLFALPTTGTIGSGFTTIIVQGRTAFGPFGAEPVFGLIGGTSVSYTSGLNLTGSGQFWAKYEIAGNESIYNLTVTLANANISIAELQFDTSWSATGFAADTAVVPEPSTIALAGLGAFAGLALKRRSRTA